MSVVADEAVDRRMAIAVTPHAPSHAGFDDARDPAHRGDVAMAFVAIYPRECMGFVVEPDERRQRVDFYPLDRLACVPGASQFGDFGMTRGDVPMAAHAALDRRDSGKRGSTSGAVAQLTVELIRLDVIAVAEIDWLFGCKRPADCPGADVHRCGGDRDQESRQYRAAHRHNGTYARAS